MFPHLSVQMVLEGRRSLKSFVSTLFATQPTSISDDYHHFERTSPLRSNWPKLKRWNPSDAKTTPETTSVPKLQPAVDYTDLSDPSSNDLSSSRESPSLLKNAFRKPSKTSWPASRPIWTPPGRQTSMEMIGSSNSADPSLSDLSSSRESPSLLVTSNQKPKPDLDYSDLSGSNDVSRSRGSSSPHKASYGNLKINSWPASRPTWRPFVRKSPKVLLNRTSMEILDSFGSSGSKLHDLFSSGDSSSSVETLSQKSNTTWGLTFGTSPKRTGRQIPMQGSFNSSDSKSNGFRSRSNISSWIPEIFRWTKEPTLKPSPETTLKPSPETTLKPSPETTLKPSPEKTLKPSPETTSVPKSEPALDESGLSGSSSNDLSSLSESSSSNDLSSLSESSSSRESSGQEPNQTDTPSSKQNSDPFKPSGLRSNLTTSSHSSWWSGLMSGWTAKPTPGTQTANKNKKPDGFFISYTLSRKGRREWHGVMLPVAEGKQLLSGDTSGVPHDATTESSKLASRLAKDPPIRVNFMLDG